MEVRLTHKTHNTECSFFADQIFGVVQHETLGILVVGPGNAHQPVKEEYEVVLSKIKEAKSRMGKEIL